MKRFLIGLLVFFVFPGLVEAKYEIEVNALTPSSVPRNAVRVPLLGVTLSVDTDMSVSEIHLRRNGLSSPSDFDRIWIETEDYWRSFRTNFQTDDIARVRFGRSIFIPKDSTKKFIVYGNLDFPAGGGRTFSISVEDIKEQGMISSPVRRYTPVRRSSYRSPAVSSESEKRYGIKCINRKCFRVER